MNKRTKKLQKGITLIALVITIIVLLILAGVSIAMLTGDNGILKKAVDVKEQTEQSAEDENVRLAISIARTNKGDFSIDLLKAELAKQGISYIENVDGSIEVTTSRTEFTITKTGEVTEIETDGKPMPKYAVNYNANGGSNVPTDTRTYKEKSTVNIDFSIIPEKIGYTFVGWASSSTAEEAEYIKGGKESFKMPKGDVTLYAIWLENKLYLYNGELGSTLDVNGIPKNECGDVTGGWIKVDNCQICSESTNNATITRGSSSLSVYSSSDIGQRCGALISTKNKIDLNNYDSLKIECTINDSSTIVFIQDNAFSGNYPSSGSWGHRYSIDKSGNHVVGVSSLDSSYLIAFGNNGSRRCTITKIWLE